MFEKPSLQVYNLVHSYIFDFVPKVEDFWSLYNHVSLASNLPPGSDYSFFKVVCMNNM